MRLAMNPREISRAWRHGHEMEMRDEQCPSAQPRLGITRQVFRSMPERNSNVKPSLGIVELKVW